MTGPGQEVDARDLAALSEAELRALIALRVRAGQDEFGDSFAGSVAAWRAGPPAQVMGLGFWVRGGPVGMALVKRPPLAPGWVPPSGASLHGLKIARQWQGRGWGRAAFGLSVRQVRKTWPETTALWLAVDAGNAAALAVYRGSGMTDSGPVFAGRVGREHRFELRLRN